MVAPGWYADPAGRYPYRYWDGGRWTDHVAGPGGQGVDPLMPVPPPQPNYPAQGYPPQQAQPAASPQDPQAYPQQQGQPYPQQGQGYPPQQQAPAQPAPAQQNPDGQGQSAQQQPVHQQFGGQGGYPGQSGYPQQPAGQEYAGQGGAQTVQPQTGANPDQPHTGAQPVAQAQPRQSAPIRTDPAELHAALAELGVRPAPEGDGSPFGEPILILTRSVEREDIVEWWTPSGLLVAVGTILEKQKPGSLQAPSTDPASGAMIGTHISITTPDGAPIASTMRTLKPIKPPTHLDDPYGNRLASVAQDKAFSKIGTFSITGPDGAPLGRLTASDMRGSSLALADPAGMPLATIVKYGKWESGKVIMEFSRNRPLQDLSQWIANRALDAVWPIRRERIMSVLIRDRPAPAPLPNLLAFTSPLIMEHISSIF